jgi:hypothetical protein
MRAFRTYRDLHSLAIARDANGGGVLEIGRFIGASMASGGLRYDTVREYEYFAEHFPMRSLPEIQALSIRAPEDPLARSLAQ